MSWHSALGWEYENSMPFWYIDLRSDFEFRIHLSCDIKNENFNVRLLKILIATSWGGLACSVIRSDAVMQMFFTFSNYEGW